MARISCNKLGEYLVSASPARRRRIITDQKHPSDVVVPMYRLALDPLEDFFAGGGTNRAALDRAAVRLRAAAVGTKWNISDRRNTAEALEIFQQVAHKLPFDSITYVRGPEQPPYLQIKSVDVSVAPNFLLRFQHRGVNCVGALKLHFPKGEESALGQEGGEYVATLLQKWLIEHGPSGCKVMASHCFSVDVFRRSVVAAPSATTRRLASIAAACEEIAAQWSRL